MLSFVMMFFFGCYVLIAIRVFCSFKILHFVAEYYFLVLNALLFSDGESFSATFLLKQT